MRSGLGFESVLQTARCSTRLGATPQTYLTGTQPSALNIPVSPPLFSPAAATDGPHG